MYMQVDAQRTRVEQDTATGLKDSGAPVDLAEVACCYLSLALSDGVLSDDEQAVHDALQSMPPGSLASPAGALLSRYVFSAQRSGRQLTGPERQLIQSAIELLRRRPEGDPPGLEGVLDLLTQFATTDLKDRELSGPEQKVIALLLQRVGSGQDSQLATVALIDRVRRLAREGANPAFIQVLHDKLAVGKTAPDALTFARWALLATPEEFADPQFVGDLMDAAAHGFGDTPEHTVHYARAQRLARKLEIDVSQVLPLTDADIQALLPLDPLLVHDLLNHGLTLPQAAQATPGERTTLLAGDATYAHVVRGLLAAGMNVHDVALYAGTIVSDQEASPAFLETLRLSFLKGASGGAAIASARYGNALSAAELADPAFLHNLLFAKNSYAPAVQAELGARLINSLAYARDHVDVFEAAEQVAVSSSNAHNGWFSNAGVFQLAGMKTDSPEWAKIEATLGRALKTEQRQEAISAARGLKDNWAMLCEHASDLNLHLRTGSSDTLEFTTDNLKDVNYSWLIAMLGNAPAAFGGASFNVISALEFLRSHIDLFEAAEQVAISSSNAHNGWFSNAGVLQLAGMKTDSPEWAKIEATLGHTLSTSDRALAIAAAKGVVENWSTLCAQAGPIGLSLREGSTDTIDFKDNNLHHLDFSPLLPLLGHPPTYDLLNALKFARAHALAQRLTGADADAVLTLDSAQIDKLLAMDPAAVKTLLAQKRSLADIAALTPEEAPHVAGLDQEQLR